jgi:hypothetical protein
MQRAKLSPSWLAWAWLGLAAELPDEPEPRDECEPHAAITVAAASKASAARPYLPGRALLAVCCVTIALVWVASLMPWVGQSTISREPEIELKVRLAERRGPLND